MASDSNQLVLHIVVVSFLCIGFYNVAIDLGENPCKMTYMYEYPQYLEIPLSKDIAASHPRYSLHLYGEGRYFEQIQNLNLEGVPLLYIPGHGGSYKQARSIGSVLLWKYINKQGPNQFNVFTVDLNEELIAFYGGTLQKQTEFIHFCIKKILSLYQGTHPPKSVAILAHSMGGIVARGLFTLPFFDRAQVNSIIMLATPNAAPVVSTDRFIADFYQKVNLFWVKNKKQLRHVMSVSIGGGDRDFQVPAALTRLPGNDTSSMFSTLATSVPNVGVSAEHQTIVWCNQLALVTARFFERLLDPSTKQITTDVAHRRRVLEYHFKRHPGVSYIPASDKPRQVRLSPSYAWKEVESLLWSVDKAEAGTGTYFTFSIEDLVGTHVPNFVSRTDSKRDKWILACKSSGSRCEEASDLSHLGITTTEYRLVHLNLTDLANEYTHIIFPASQASATTLLDVNALSDLEMSNKIDVPHVFSNLWTMNKGQQHSIPTAQSRFYYRVELDGFQAIYQAFQISISGTSQNKLLRMQVPWDEGQTTYGMNNILAKLHRIPADNEGKVVLHIYLKADQPVVVDIKVDFFAVLGSIVRCFGVSIPVYIISNIMLTYVYQVNQIHLLKPCHSIADAHSINAKPFKVQPFIIFYKHFSSYAWFATIWTVLQFPQPDSIILEEKQRMWFNFVPLIMFLYAFEMFSATRLVQNGLMLLLNPIVVKVSESALFGMLQSWKLAKFLLHSSILAILLSICSSLAFLYMFVLSFLSVCYMRHQAAVELKFPQNLTESEKKKLNETEAIEALPPSKNNETENKISGDKETDSSKMSTKPNEENLEPRTGDDAPVENSEVAQEQTTAPAFQQAKQFEPKPTTVLEDCYSVNFIVMQLWLWLFLLSLPFLGVLLVNFRDADDLPADPMLVEAAVASLLFVTNSLFSTYDGIAKSKLAFLSYLKFPVMVLMVMLSAHSLHRAPYFILIYLGLHTVTQVI